MYKNGLKRGARERRGERGAALITSLLMATLLLAAGGAVIVAGSLANTTAIDSTAELQAYYAAEAGLQAGLNVLRGNTAPLAGNTTATFRNAVTNPTLNLWLSYGANSRVALSATTAYDVTVSDPDNTPAGQEPGRLILRSTGYGPKGAIKRLELMVARLNFNYDPKSTILLNGAGGAIPPPITFDIGSSNSKEYTGHDAAGTGTILPVFGLTNGGDQVVATTTIATKKPTTVENPATGMVTNSDLPPWLQSPDLARSFLSGLQATAVAQGRYYTSAPSDIGSTATPRFTFIDGDASIGPGSGAGLLVCTGNLTLKGNFSFNGLILVLGTGNLVRNGGGDGTFLGAIVVASFDRNTAGAPFQAPVYNTNGGGNSSISYDSSWVQKGLDSVGSRVIGVREY